MAVALRPLLISFYCLGINLNEHQHHKTLQRIYSTILFVLITAVSCSSTISIFKIQFETTDWRVTANWDAAFINSLTNNLSYNIVNTFLTITVLYFLSWNGVGDLWKALRQLEALQLFDSQFYRKIRKRSWMAVIYVFTDAS